MKLIRELREENARLKAMLGQNMATVSSFFLPFKEKKKWSF